MLKLYTEFSNSDREGIILIKTFIQRVSSAWIYKSYWIKQRKSIVWCYSLFTRCYCYIGRSNHQYTYASWYTPNDNQGAQISKATSNSTARRDHHDKHTWEYVHVCMYGCVQWFKWGILILSVSCFWTILDLVEPISFPYDRTEYLLDMPLFLIWFAMRFMVSIPLILNWQKCY